MYVYTSKLCVIYYLSIQLSYSTVNWNRVISKPCYTKHETHLNQADLLRVISKPFCARTIVLKLHVHINITSIFEDIEENLFCL